jgi:MoaA/NifB/PqqE/SkfB family radical SAM enzyme
MLNNLKKTIIRCIPKKLRKDYYNVFAHITDYSVTPKPRYVHFEITYRCSCKCSFCSRWEMGPSKIKEELSTSEITAFLEDAIEMGVSGISFSGGEPFIRSDIFDVISFCKKKGLPVHVNSNGTLINEKNYKQINSMVDSLLISVDSSHSDIHDSLRGVPGTFEKAMQALNLIDPAKTMVQLVVNSRNIDTLPEYVLSMAKRVRKIRLQPIHHNPENLLTMRDSTLGHFDGIEKKWNAFINELKGSGLKLYGAEKFYRLFPDFLSNQNKLQHRTDCFMGSHAFFLDPYGNIVPCEGIRKPFGNIRDKRFRDIWRGAKNFRRVYNKKSKRPCVCLYSCLESDIVFWDNFFSLEKVKCSYP